VNRDRTHAPDAAARAAPARDHSASVPASGRAHAGPGLRATLGLYALIASGTVIGGVLRALLAVWTLSLPGLALPWSTLFANVAGSFLIGFYATLTGAGGRLPAGLRQRQFVMSGICGGFTTFSIFSLETLRLAQAAQWQAAGLNVAVSVLACVAAVWLGHLLAARCNPKGA
jgi:CrcB protein